MADLHVEIEQRNREFMDAFNSGDAAGTAALYTEDARVLPPGGAAVSGRDAIEQLWKGAMALGVREIDLRTGTVESAGDLAYEIGSATLTLEPGDSTRATEAGKYVVVWERRSGRWQMAVDIWNKNA